MVNEKKQVCDKSMDVLVKELKEALDKNKVLFSNCVKLSSKIAKRDAKIQELLDKLKHKK